MSLQAQLGRLYTTRRHRVTFLHWCVHSMATNLNSEPSQPPSSVTVELHQILEIAPSHFAILSTSKQGAVTESHEDFLTAYGRIGSTAAHHHIADLFTRFSLVK